MMNAMVAKRQTEQAIAEYQEQAQAWAQKVIAQIEKEIEDQISFCAKYRLSEISFYICSNSPLESSLYFDVKNYSKEKRYWEFDSADGVKILSEALVMYLAENGYEAFIKPVNNTRYKIMVKW